MGLISVHAMPHSLQTYPPPVLPRDFKPVHKATSTETGVRACVRAGVCVREVNGMHTVVVEYMMGHVPSTSCAMVQVPAISSTPHTLSCTPHTLSSTPHML